MGKLANFLKKKIDDKVSENESQSDIIKKMAEAAGIEPGTVNQILDSSIKCPPRIRLVGFARVLGFPIDEIISEGESDGCTYNAEEGAKADLGYRILEGEAVANLARAEKLVNKMDIGGFSPLTRAEEIVRLSNLDDNTFFATAAAIDVTLSHANKEVNNLNSKASIDEYSDNDFGKSLENAFQDCED